MFQEMANCPPVAISLSPYPSSHLVSLTLSPLHILEALAAVLFPNLQSLLKETNQKEKILSELIAVALTTRSSMAA